MYNNRTLVVIFCMHRSGSSFTAQFLQRLGMSLGPFDLIGALESNPYGHFEALPFQSMNRDIQLQALGFSDDFPATDEMLRRFRETEGRWPADVAISDADRQQAKQLLHQLVSSGPVSGFKDPRTVLTWPFWRSVLQDFPGLRVVGLFLLRSPHEIAMSLFQRAAGNRRYTDALDIAAVHFRRMQDIYDTWQGDRAVVQFDPRNYERQARSLVELCGLTWNDSALAEVYDPACRHQRACIVAHDAQEAFENLGGAKERLLETENLRNLMADTATREDILRRRLLAMAGIENENGVLRAQLTEASEELLRLQTELAGAASRERSLETGLRESRDSRSHLELQLREATDSLAAVRQSLHDAQQQLAAGQLRLHTREAEKALQQSLQDAQQQLAADQLRLHALEAEKTLWDKYRSSHGWAVLEAGWRLRNTLIPKRSLREAAAKKVYHLVRDVYRHVRRAA